MLKKIHSLLSANELNLLSIYILKHVIFTGQFLANNTDFFFFFNLSPWSLNVAFTDPQCVLGNVFSYTSAFNFTVLSARRNFSFVLALLLLLLWRFSSFHQVFCLSAWNQDKRRTDQQTSSFQILVNNTCTFGFFFCPPSLSTFSTSPSQDTTSVWFAVWSCILMRMG